MHLKENGSTDSDDITPDSLVCEPPARKNVLQMIVGDSPRFFSSRGTLEVLEPPQTLVGVAGSTLDLPCNITAPTPDDSVALVLWYKDESTTPLYSLDARRGLLDQARHAASDLLNGRAYLSITHRPSTLQLKPLLEDDEGQYRCRVDFRKARTRNFDVILNVVGR
ncbi:ig-like domain-containing protein [Trichonephila clavata]|uniref:Ig-like domain-containing protein n=1 Tax=Trichonephila clavata TaxID=2740835 RepID=A0A8X6L3A8_TRICU|nr:ig-like domain-containing protein [Trichonephila clavata]